MHEHANAYIECAVGKPAIGENGERKNSLERSMECA
jgi:hypothetical protein